MSGPDNDEADIGRSALQRAAAWLSVHLDDCPRPIIPYVKQAYNLGNVDAVEAVRLATLKRAEARDG